MLLPKMKRDDLIKQFKADNVKNANVIVDFLQLLESNEVKEVKSGIYGLQALFVHLFKNGGVQAPSELPDDLMTASQKFNKWLFERYNETLKKLVGLLNHEVGTISEGALAVFIKLIKVEGQCKKHKIPSSRLQALLEEIISSDVDHKNSIKKVNEYLECEDFMFQALLCLSNIVKKKKKEVATGKVKITEEFVNNLLFMLEQINIPNDKDGSITCTRSFLQEDEDTDKPEQPSKKAKGKSEFKPKQKMKPESNLIPYADVKKAMNIIWGQVITYPLTSHLYRRCLIIIPDKVIQHLKQPLSLTGFFMDAYDVGGAVSLMALQGVFILVNKYNLDYPHFYQKLYGLLEPTVFHAKYKPRFFMLMDRFLASSHIPEYIVAGFIKRLARLSLSAPVSCLVLILKFIANLLIRFPGLEILIHNPNANTFENDPYDHEEPDLSKCRASESSLWEVATLQDHVIPSVSKATGFLQKALPAIEYEISEYVETTYEEVHEKACKLAVHETVSTTFHKPTGLFTHHDDKMSDVWSVM